VFYFRKLSYERCVVHANEFDTKNSCQLWCSTLISFYTSTERVSAKRLCPVGDNRNNSSL
jgi:hypothetical protein